ncbi:hypothetical protein AGMMS50268_03790 [Spirochaetia bacterium]|nr:hypothetical protein AGMMS50268_03790 [Spirochaetia bacterium]
MKIARVFPRRTNSTPVDNLAFIGHPDLFSGLVEVDKIHISVTFSWDLPDAEKLYKEWSEIAPTEIGGPATGQRGDDFTPGMYLKKGYVITSRGCPNRCWFCSVWRREGDTLRELPVTEGWNILDDNLLACTDDHIKTVFAMLARQKKRPFFTGGLEAAKLKPWHVKEFAKLNPIEMFFAYDTPNDREPLFEAGKILKAEGFKVCHPLRCYTLIGFPGDTFEKAETRLFDCVKAGFMPMAMLYRNQSGERDSNWIRFTWPWARPATVRAKCKEAGIWLAEK